MKAARLSSGPLGQEYLRARLKWFIRLRWVALIAAVAMTALGYWGFGIPFALWIPATCLGTLALLNVGFVAVLPHVRRPRRFAFGQLSVDVLAVSILFAATGGAHNPFWVIYFFHVLLGAMLLPPRLSYVMTGVIVVAFSGMALAAAHQLFLARDMPEVDFNRAVYDGFLTSFTLTALGMTYFMVSVMRDLERSAQKRQQLEHSLLQQDKLAAIGRLAAGVAHELNTPLGSIGLLAGEIAATVADQQGGAPLAETAATLRTLSETITRETERCATITRGLLAYARKREPGVCAPVALRSFLADVVAVVERTRGTEVPIVLASVPDATVTFDGLAVRQVLTNLLANALDAVAENPPGRVARVTLTVRLGDRPPVESEVAGGNWLMVEVADTGPGVAREIRDRVFEPFFTTKEVGRGTGLGLSVSYAIARELGGVLRLSDAGSSAGSASVTEPESAPAAEPLAARGARFTLSLPVDLQAPAGGEPPENP